MRQFRYVVVHRQDAWFIHFHAEDYGPYKTQVEAMLFAVEAAQHLGERGDNAEVCLMGDNGQIRSEWAYGRDAYPPNL
jgi:hypothetical protein